MLKKSLAELCRQIIRMQADIGAEDYYNHAGVVWQHADADALVRLVEHGCAKPTETARPMLEAYYLALEPLHIMACNRI